MNGHRLRVWVGRDGIRFVSCFYASIVVSGVSYAANSNSATTVSFHIL